MGLFGKSREERERQQRFAEEKAAMERGVALAAEEDEKQLQNVKDIVRRIDAHNPSWTDVSRERNATTVLFEAAAGLHGAIGYTNSGGRDGLYIEISQREGDKDLRVHYHTVESAYNVRTDFDRYKWVTRKPYSFLWEKIKAIQQSLKDAELERNRPAIEKARREQEELQRKADVAKQRFFQS